MIFKAKFKDGKFELPAGVTISEGSEVVITAPDVEPTPSFGERYAKYIGIVTDMPSDLAENLDHYLHGHPKK